MHYYVKEHGMERIYLENRHVSEIVARRLHRERTHVFVYNDDGRIVASIAYFADADMYRLSCWFYGSYEPSGRWTTPIDIPAEFHDKLEPFITSAIIQGRLTS